MKPQFIIFVCFVLFPGCSQSTHKKDIVDNKLQISTINIDSALANVSDIPFKCSEFIDSIVFIPLETKKESLLGGRRGASIFSTPQYIYCDLKKFNLFDGRFIHQVGKQGRGPGEYLNATGSTTDIVDNRVFVLDAITHHVLIYDKDNNFIKSIDVIPEITGINYLGNNNLMLMRDAGLILYSNAVPFEYQIYNLNEERITYSREIDAMKVILKNRSYESFISFGIGRNLSWSYNNNIQLYESFSDTIFSIDSNKNRIPRFYVKRNKFKPSIDEMLDNISFENNNRKNVEVRSVFETPRFLFIMLTKGEGESYYARFDKVTQETKIVPLEGAFDNDLSLLKFGGVKNIPGTTSGIDFLESPYTINNFLSKVKNTPSSEWTEATKKLYDILSELSLEDNGIICLYKFIE